MAALSDAPRIPVPSSGRLIPRANAALIFGGIAVVCWVAAGVIGVLVVTQLPALIASDASVGSWVDGLGLQHRELVDLALIWHWAGGPTGSFVLVTITTLWLLVIKRRYWALYVIACGVGGLVIAEAIKRTVDRPRPTWPDPVIVESGGSFPSGHSMAGVYVWSVVGIVLIYLLRRPVGTILGWSLIAFGLFMAPSRLVIGVHWPSDVVAGWLLALGWVLLVSACAIVLVAQRNMNQTPVPNELEPATSP